MSTITRTGLWISLFSTRGTEPEPLTLTPTLALRNPDPKRCRRLAVPFGRYQIACGFYDIEQVWTPRKAGRTLVSLSDSSDSDDSSAPLKVEQEEGSGLTSSSSSPYSSCGSEQGFTTGDNSASLDSIDGHDDFKEKHHQ